MKTTTHGLTRRQLERVENFLSQFTDIEKALKRKLRLHADDHTPVSAMAKRYAEMNPYWRKSEMLFRLAEIRNVLTHQRSLANGYPIALSENSVKEIGALHADLMAQAPCSMDYQAKVQTVESKDFLSSVVEKIYEFEFSQFPVVDNGRFVGLITENEIVHWLGHCAKANRLAINLAEVSVSKVLKEKGPYRKGSNPFRFAKLSAPLVEVMSLFALHPTLEVIFLTESGRNHDKIEGIITEWDAARFVELR